jgi:Cache 3/Cache 2 fusion domain
MRSHPSTSIRSRPGIAFAMMLALVGAVIALIEVAGGSRLAAQPSPTLEASIFSYDGHEFVRTHSTLLTEAGTSAVNTTLDHDTPAYKALTQKHSYTGDATVFGKHYDANYAPLTDHDGRLTGALFVAVPK